MDSLSEFVFEQQFCSNWQFPDPNEVFKSSTLTKLQVLNLTPNTFEFSLTSSITGDSIEVNMADYTLFRN